MGTRESRRGPAGQDIPPPPHTHTHPGAEPPVLAGEEGHTCGRGAGAHCWREGQGVGVALAGRGRGGARRGEGAHRAGAAVAGSSLLGLLQESGSKGATGRRLSRRAREARLAPGAGMGGVRKLGTQCRSTLGLWLRGGRPLPAAGSGAAPGPDGAAHLRSARPSSAWVRVPAGRLEWVERGRRGEEAAPRQFLSSADHRGGRQGWVAGSEVGHRWVFVHLPGGVRPCSWLRPEVCARARAPAAPPAPSPVPPRVSSQGKV